MLTGPGRGPPIHLGNYQKLNSTIFMTKPLALLLSLLPISAAAAIVLDIETATKVQFASVSGRSYQVYAADHANDQNWTAVGTPQAGTGDTITFFHTTSGDQKLFFKVEELPNPAPSSPGTPIILLQRARLNLDGQDLSGLTLTNLDLNNFSFLNSKFDGSNLRNSRLRGARFGGATFRNVDLRGADLSDAQGQGANFTGADLRDAKLATGLGSIFVGANLENLEVIGLFDFNGDVSGANVKGLKAPGVRLFLENAAGLDFSGSDFSSALIAGGMSFAGANLTGVKFNNASFSYNAIGIEQFRVRFDNANLTNADLSGATGFYDAPGIIFSNTRMPDGTIRNN
jgi:uncharacterized protein YjbI with pentapeptide repeats